jgi:hypothetical protein
MTKSEKNHGENVELMQTSACASLAESLADIGDGYDFNKGENNEVIELADICLEDLNPFNGVTTPKFYCKILKTGGGNAKNMEERGKNARSSIHKVQEEMAAMEHAVHSKRGMSIQTKVSFGFLAQNEDNADQQHADWWLMATIKQIKTNQKLIDKKMKMMDTMVDGALKTQILM